MNACKSSPSSSVTNAALRLGLAGRFLPLALVLLAGCSSDTGTDVPRLFALTGRLQLQGRLFALDGTPMGNRAVHDADSVRVYLHSDGGVLVDSTLTVDGAYGFSVYLGNYQAIARVAPGIADSTIPLHVHNVDRVFADTLRLTGGGEVFALPNPFSTQTAIRFSIPIATDATVALLRPSGSQARLLLSRSFAAGLHDAIWDGLDNGSAVVPAGPYWIVLTRDGLNQAELVFKEP